MIPTLLLLLAGHSASQGKSSFDIAADGTVDIEIQLSALDLPELCNVDLSVRDRATEEARLDTCVTRGLPMWLRISSDLGSCPISTTGWHQVEAKTVPPVVALDGGARCSADARSITIDWGLFAGSPLDYTSVARADIDGQDAQMFAFSKRARKWVLPLHRGLHWGWWLAGGVTATLLAAALAALFIARRRRRG